MALRHGVFLLVVLVYLAVIPQAYAGTCSLCHEEIEPGLAVSGEFGEELHCYCAFISSSSSSSAGAGGGAPVKCQSRQSTYPPEMARLNAMELADELAKEAQASGQPSWGLKPGGGHPVGGLAGGGASDELAGVEKGPRGPAGTPNQVTFSYFVTTLVHDFSNQDRYLNPKLKRENGRVARAALNLKNTKVIPVNRFDPVIQKRVTKRFAALGDMHEVLTPDGRSILMSGTAGELMSQADGEWFCKNLGRGARLPSVEDYQTFANALFQGPEGGFDFEVVPELSSKTFWTAPTVTLEPIVFVFEGEEDTDRDSDEEDKFEAYELLGHQEDDLNSIRCVVD